MLRHGESEGGDIFRGKIDVPLTQKGQLQMEESLSGFSGWQSIVSSPLLRCKKIAEAKAVELGLPFVVDRRLSEISFGDWDGERFSVVKEQDAERFKRFWQNPAENTPPNAEPLAQFSQRIVSALEALISDNQGQHILAVVHGGVIRAILSDVLQADFSVFMRFDVPYACFSRIKIYHDDDKLWPQLVFHNR